MKNILCIVVFSIFAISVQAQPQRKEKFERIHAAKVAYMTDRLGLTTNQAERFWPVFNEYESERMAIRRKYYPNSNEGEQGKKHGNLDKTEEDGMYMQSIEDNLDLQQAQLDLKRKYNNEFLQILSAQQVSMLYKAEKEFRQLLIQKLREKRGGRHWEDNR